MLPAFARRPLLARMFNAAANSTLHVSSSSHQLISSSLTSLLRPSILPAYRRFANTASTAPSTTSATSTSPPPAPTSNAPESTATSDSNTAAAPRKRASTRRSSATSQQSKEREKQLALLQRAKQQERLKKALQRAAQGRMKKQLKRIMAREAAIARTALVRQKRQLVKDKLRAKAAHEKQQRAEEKSVAQRYKEVRATRPKRPLSAFLSFSQTFRTSLPASTAKARPSPIETTRLAAARWRELTADEKSKHEAQYKAALPAYEQALQQWNEQQRTHRPPTRPLNAYARYAQQRIKDIRAAEGGGSKASDLMKRIAVEWKGVGEEEKQRLRQQVEGEKAGYADRLKAWEARPVDEQAMWRLQRATDRKKRAKRKTKTALTKQAADKATSNTAQ